MNCYFHINQRLSYDQRLCTLRYIGPVDGTVGEWLGVEWDDIHKGKHSGEHGGQKYFECRVPNSGSFVRQSRVPDPTLSFLEALRKKYTTADDPQEPQAQISISANKVVEEIGFDKILDKLSRLRELKVVLLDKMDINRADGPELIRETCPNIEELDVSRNRFEDLESISTIVSGLSNLKSLRISGNRFSSLDTSSSESTFKTIDSLEINNTLMSWEETAVLLQPFQNITTLESTLNNIDSIPFQINDKPLSQIFPTTLSTLNLERNTFQSLCDIFPLATLPNLERLVISHNDISTLFAPLSTTTKTLPVFEKIAYLDLSYNSISDFPLLDILPALFPALRSLRISHNPLYDNIPIEEAHMLTVGRLTPVVEMLNYSKITPQERANAEMYYLSRIAKDLSNAGEGKEGVILKMHRRWDELCALHGEPAIVRTADLKKNLGSKLIELEFITPHKTTTKRIPKSTSISALKCLLGKLLGMKPLRMSLKYLPEDEENAVMLEDDLKDLEFYIEQVKGKIYVEGTQP